MTLEFAQMNAKFVRKILENETIQLSQVTKDKIYPIINGASGAAVAHKFLSGIENLGLGHISPRSKCFKRANPDQNECNEKNLKKKFKMLNIQD